MTEAKPAPPYHGSPYDRGDSDAHYRRKYQPHKKVSGRFITALTSEEITQYRKGFDDNPSGTKDWS